jgi:DNA-binding response OmpR family regulator
MKILIIEDEKELRKSVISYLSSEGYLCESAATSREAIDKIGAYDYDCFIVDIMLPDGNGLDIIREIKAKGIEGGVIIVSAKNSLEDRIEGLEIGSDDYLVKPFHLSELNARVKSILRRRNFSGVNEVVFEEIKVNLDSHTVYVNGESVAFTGKEYDILLYFLSNKGRVIAKDSLAEHVWGDYIDGADSLDFIYTHIKNTRKKLIDAGAKDYIKTVYGVGYKFTT